MLAEGAVEGDTTVAGDLVKQSRKGRKDGGVLHNGNKHGNVGQGNGEGLSCLVAEVLGDAMCGLCSELLLDVGVLPCSHSFCNACWAKHVEEKGTT